MLTNIAEEGSKELDDIGTVGYRHVELELTKQFFLLFIV